jgi:lipopolysaccharide export LptBFGC system permease protein LptF
MSTIDRYLARTFVGSYLLLMLVGFGLYVGSDVLVNLDEFTKDRTLSASTVLLNMADYYGNNLALYYQQLGGAMLTVAAGFTFAMMMKNNELVPLVAAGVPLQRLARPVLLCSVVLVAAWVANSEVLVPRLAHKIARQHDDLAETRQVDVRCVRDDRNAILIAHELHVQPGLLRGVHIIEPDEQGAPKSLIRADGAHYDAARGTWVLDRGARQVMGAAFEGAELGRAIHWEPLAEYPFALSPEQILLRQSSQWADLMSISQMKSLLRSRNLPNLAAVAKSLDIRITQIPLVWILMLLAIPFFLTREPGNVLVAGGKALLLTGLCFAVVFVSHSVSTDSYSARVATALPVLVFGPLAVLHFANVKT